MATLNTIKNWFKTGLKPTQQQFWDTWDSFWHKDDKIPLGNVNGLNERFLEKADQAALTAHFNDGLAHQALLGTKADKTVVEQLATALENKQDKIAPEVILVYPVDPGQTFFLYSLDGQRQAKYGEYPGISVEQSPDNGQNWSLQIIPITNYMDGNTKIFKFQTDNVYTKIIIS